MTLEAWLLSPAYLPRKELKFFLNTGISETKIPLPVSSVKKEGCELAQYLSKFNLPMNHLEIL